MKKTTKKTANIAHNAGSMQKSMAWAVKMKLRVICSYQGSDRLAGGSIIRSGGIVYRTPMVCESIKQSRNPHMLNCQPDAISFLVEADNSDNPRDDSGHI
ncbi:hypothetical protein T310_1944 [Rasamsonia emersonii CBS 393.64]|uniref:Uncharacterized protein n=1 Tax=Rasamsonia emersonii (strain ATCC 16479 / CBS 393.64 / IMI 116815) TaxID=1408163 RepID=A0A0F4Z2A9_RASE3|nr:hypothetical protein T310_1944 [Rasamsonia emersonii CBS 393.64]KKA24023.1 hypothetical protein T310_1944 [Rasamsonia emersonii CBS 393.64]